MRISEQQQYLDAAGRRVLITNRQKAGGLWIYHGFEVDRAGRRVGEWRMYKSDGRDWSGSMAHNIIREAAIDLKLADEAAVVLERLIEACETDIAMPTGRIGPKAYGNGMPSPIMTEFDVWLIEVHDYNDDGGPEHTRRRNTAILDSDVRRAKCSPSRVSRMEEALGWLGKYVHDHEARLIVISYASCKANGGDWSDYITSRNRRYRKREPWVKRTLYRRIAKTLHDIATKLRKDEITLREWDSLHMAHEAA